MSPQTPEPSDPRSLGDLVADLSAQGARLVRAEIDLAKAELAGKAQQLGIGVGLIGAAAVLGMYAFGAAIATGIIALSLVLPPWLAALAVTGLLLVLAAILALVGRSRLQKGSPPTPARAVESVQADVQVVKKGLQS
jgi:hypothetical protein